MTVWAMSLCVDSNFPFNWSESHAYCTYCTYSLYTSVSLRVLYILESWPCTGLEILFYYLSRWLAFWQVGDPSALLVHCSRECTPPYLSTGISNLLQPAQAEVVWGQHSMYLASWVAAYYSTIQILSVRDTVKTSIDSEVSPLEKKSDYL